MEKDYRKIIISGSGEGDFASLSAAAESCSVNPKEPVHFIVKNGIYRERPFLELEDYIIEGESAEHTVITASCGGRDPWPGEEKTGTFRSQTLFLGGNRAKVCSITIENTAGDGAKVGQALAVYADALQVFMDGVTLLGNQDTLFTAPLPLKEREPGGFRGPREHAPRRNTEQYYRNCRIAGNIDFIFGGADAVFDHCRIEPVPHAAGTCYITAPSTPKNREGYLFTDCEVKGTCPDKTVYLGRPWRENASCWWMNCSFDGEISPEHWDNWRNPENEKTARFGEYGSCGAGAVKAGGFGIVDDDKEYRRKCRYLQDMRENLIW
jgi:pectinesterase